MSFEVRRQNNNIVPPTITKSLYMYMVHLICKYSFKKNENKIRKKKEYTFERNVITD